MHGLIQAHLFATVLEILHEVLLDNLKLGVLRLVLLAVALELAGGVGKSLAVLDTLRSNGKSTVDLLVRKLVRLD
jgi:hypothetical protein